MAEIDQKILANVQKFINNLNKAGIHISQAYLFGSLIAGHGDKWSDIDIAIVSPQISDDRFEERVRLMQIAVKIDDRIEPLPFNPQNFVREDPIVREILKNGAAVLPVETH